MSVGQIFLLCVAILSTIVFAILMGRGLCLSQCEAEYRSLVRLGTLMGVFAFTAWVVFIEYGRISGLF